ncbi:trypsin-like peptidase domain-containing protein [Streptomyces lunaelactis]|uniref:S1C family serine protease n=1 Tax=Streptomyces lunaelactis TaxID=1535768 RepID=UPI001585B059|nr:trypsin-like peptidase domain-containing protein [Streptomyces lunaelactis]NUK03659.1 trypsin-like peptidase domain-containing protein [Streptomyces lunaelactis]NUK14896.1 trypsin-like peptidase domain-containing protein [Streptomyces lunaelactis]NUK25612.1 trypsin-like peptidase domain-containing protein [Streptomyces lunaelactis]NUK36927.1 trypsin-like peptidase domain-containing protein [Streptomyces lunaelactis]NUK43542.1 trypsin-like peptidase domain-containing protein [Streptomyces lu
MSSENEGNEGTAVPAAPAVPSVPPVPAAAPEGTPASANASRDEAQEPAAAAAEQPGHSPQPEQAAAPLPGYVPAAYPAEAPAGATVGTTAGAQQPGATWPPPPPALPSYGGGAGGGPVWGAQVAEPPRKRSGGLVAAVLVAALVAGGVGGGIGYWAAERNDDTSGSTTVAAAEAPRDLKRDPGTVASVAGKALPSVVTIEAKAGGAGTGESSETEGGTGTGFVYDKEGHILTNNHVVASAADGGTLSATFSNGKKYDAEVVGRAEGYDVAVLKLKNAPSGLTPLALGNSEQVAVGDSTIAIGAPFGLSNTVTTGIISAKNRPVASGDGSSGKNSYMSALQTDASINPGNSGGPLLDSRGAVIGINSAIQSAGSGGLGQTQAGSIGLGFAIPINQAKNVAEQLIKTGKPVYPVIGATVDMSGKDPGAKIATEGAGGTEAVTPNGPAAKAGFKAGDVITKFNGKPIDSGPTLISEIWNHKPGDKVTLTFQRDGKEKTADVVLGERKGDS